jgi:orotate phosphoribosyltransferase
MTKLCIFDLDGTVLDTVETIAYYGGHAVGIAAIFATVDTVEGLPVRCLFNPNDLPGYTTSDAAACPLCKAGQRLDAIVNSFGYSKL